MDRYEEERTKWKWDVPEYFNFTWDVVDRWAEDRTKLALISVDENGDNPQYHTFWDLKILSKKFANYLREIGIKKGDRVFLLIPRIPEFYIAVLALNRIGAVFMPTPTLSTPHDIKYRVNSAEAVAAIVDHDYADRVDEARKNLKTLKHYIVVGGERRHWVSYEKVMESALQEHPAVVESAVIGVPDPDGVRGQLVKAYVVLKKRYEASKELKKELQDHVKKLTAPYKYPRIIEFVDADYLPKTQSGKIKRKELRKMEEAKMKG